MLLQNIYPLAPLFRVWFENMDAVHVECSLCCGTGGGVDGSLCCGTGGGGLFAPSGSAE